MQNRTLIWTSVIVLSLVLAAKLAINHYSPHEKKTDLGVNNVSSVSSTPLLQEPKTDPQAEIKETMQPVSRVSPGQGLRTKELFSAIEEFDEKAILKAIDDGADINAHDPDDSRHFTPLLKASHDVSEGFAESSVRVVELLLSKGADINKSAPDGTTALVRAACDNDTNMVRLLLERGADANLGNYPGILCAVHYNSPEMVSLFILHKANVNALDGTGRSPLKEAIKSGNTEIQKLLLNAGAKGN